MKFTNPIKAIGFSILAVSIEILHKKIGGLASGGRYSESHSFDELQDYTSEFIFTFIVVFLAVYLYDSFSIKKHLICPKCEEPFTSYKKSKDSKCVECDIEGVEIKKYYKNKKT